MEALNVLFITSQFPPKQVGGAGTYALHLVKELGKMGQNIHLVSEEDFRDTNIKGYTVESINIPYIRFISFAYNAKKVIKKILTERKIDIIHGNALSSFAALDVKVPKVETLHSLSEDFQFRNKIEKRLTTLVKRKVLGCCDGLILVSEYTKRRFVELYPNFSKSVKVIYNGIDVSCAKHSSDEIKSFKDKLKIGNKFIILTISRLSGQKGIDMLIKSVSDERIKSKVKVLIVGDGRARNALTKAVNQLNLKEEILFLGQMSEEDVMKLYDLADVYVLPSRVENYNLTLLDALARGKAIVTTKVGGNPEIIKHMVNGILVEPDSPSGLGDSIIAVLSNETLKKRLEINALESAKRLYTWKEVALQSLQFYKEIISES